MQRLEVEYRAEALSDLDEIYDYVLDQTGAWMTADRYVERIRTACARIALAPGVGAARDDLSPGLRTVRFERRAVIVFSVDDGRVTIVNVLHGGRDLERFFRPAPDHDA